MCGEFRGKYLVIYWGKIDSGKACEIIGKTLRDH